MNELCNVTIEIVESPIYEIELDLSVGIGGSSNVTKYEVNIYESTGQDENYHPYYKDLFTCEEDGVYNIKCSRSFIAILDEENYQLVVENGVYLESDVRLYFNYDSFQLSYSNGTNITIPIEQLIVGRNEKSTAFTDFTIKMKKGDVMSCTAVIRKEYWNGTEEAQIEGDIYFKNIFYLEKIE